MESGSFWRLKRFSNGDHLIALCLGSWSPSPVCNMNCSNRCVYPNDVNALAILNALLRNHHLIRLLSCADIQSMTAICRNCDQYDSQRHALCFHWCQMSLRLRSNCLFKASPSVHEKPPDGPSFRRNLLPHRKPLPVSLYTLQRLPPSFLGSQLEVHLQRLSLHCDSFTFTNAPALSQLFGTHLPL